MGWHSSAGPAGRPTPRRATCARHRGTCRPRARFYVPALSELPRSPAPLGPGPLDVRPPRPRGSRLLLGPRSARRLLCGLVAGPGVVTFFRARTPSRRRSLRGGDVFAPSGLVFTFHAQTRHPVKCPRAKQVQDCWATGPGRRARPLGPHGARLKVPGRPGVGACAPGSGTMIFYSMRLR